MIIVLSKILCLFYLTVSIVCSYKSTFDVNFYSAGIDKHYIQEFVPLDCLIFILCFLILYFVVNILSKYICSWRSDNIIETGMEKKSLIFFFILLPVILFAFWLPYFLSFYPGTGMQDELLAIHDPIRVSNQPLYYNLLLNYTWEFGKRIGYETLGFGLLSFFQEMIMILSLVYLLYWLFKKRAPYWYLAINFLIFLILPIFPNYAFCFVKDKLFAVSLLLLSLLLYDFSIDRKNEINNENWCIGFIVLCSILFFLRGNGRYIFLSVILSMIILENIAWKKILTIGSIVVLIGLSQDFILMYRYNLQTPFKEAIAVPLQQVARTVALNGQINDGQRMVIDRLLPYEQWKKLYKPGTPDWIKWNPEFDENYLNSHKKEFYKTYLELFFRNKRIFIEAHLFETYGFWSLLTWSPAQSVFTCAYTDKILNLTNPIGKVNHVFNVSDIGFISESFKYTVGRFMQEHVIYLGAGTCAWITIFSLLVCLWKKEYYKVLALIPVLSCWLTLLIASPIAFGFRYAFCFALCMPLIVGLPFVSGKNQA